MKHARRETRRRSPWRRRGRQAIIALSLAYLVPVTGGCMNPSLPFDLAINLPGVTRVEEAVADADVPTLVVLQHGLWRSWGSLWRLERGLEQHGYEVLNFSYPSTRAYVEDHARLLHERLEAALAARDGPPPRLCFVGHSMGGLVIRSYLAREDARKAYACVFIGTPHRGAALADARSSLYVFRMFMGDKAALQLRPSAKLYETLGPVPCERIGTIVGSRGTEEGWNPDIPGDDDGTVGVDEAQLPEQTDCLLLRQRHTFLSCSQATAHAVLRFLRFGKF